MRGTAVLDRVASAFAGLWALVLVLVASVGIAVAQEAGHRNIPGDAHLWELAERTTADAATASTVDPADVFLYELSRRAAENVPATVGFDWTWILVGAVAAIAVIAATMLVVTARRHHGTLHLPVRRGHA